MRLASLSCIAVALSVGGLVSCSGPLQRPVQIYSQTESAPPHPLPGELSRGHVLIPTNGRATAQLIVQALQAGGDQQSFSLILDRLKVSDHPLSRRAEQTAVYFSHRQCSHADGLVGTFELKARTCSTGVLSFHQMIFSSEDHTFEIGDIRAMLANAGFQASASPIRFHAPFERRSILYSLFLREAGDPVVVVAHNAEGATPPPRIHSVYVLWPDKKSTD